VVIPSYHPAAALRFGPAGAPRAGLAADLSSAAGRLEALSAGELVFGPATADAAAHVHALTTAAFRALPALDPPSGVFRETVDTVAAELTAQPGIAAYRFARMVGVLRLDVRAGALWLRRVAVDPTLHGSGIGSQLVDWTHDWARQAGFRSTRVGVRSGLDRPQRFWARHGYRPVATHDFWIEYERAG
jgi:predicted N-acetyltransferase YhbS